MPSWKKVITSGSDASLNSLTVATGITGSSLLITGSTGTLFTSNVDTLLLTGSLIVTGSSILSGSLNVTQGITGSLFGTSSYATIATNAISSSKIFIENNPATAGTYYPVFVSEIQGHGIAKVDSSTYTYDTTTNTLTVTSSYSNASLSSSYALTASYALSSPGGGGPTFPYIGNAEITGSLNISGSLIVNNTNIISTIVAMSIVLA
jgi:hypothetical protein